MVDNGLPNDRGRDPCGTAEDQRELQLISSNAARQIRGSSVDLVTPPRSPTEPHASLKMEPDNSPRARENKLAHLRALASSASSASTHGPINEVMDLD